MAGAVPVLEREAVRDRVESMLGQFGSGDGGAASVAELGHGAVAAALARVASPSAMAAIRRSAACVASVRACLLHLEDRVTAESDLASGAAQHDTEAFGMPAEAAELARSLGGAEAVAECWGVARPHWRRAVWESRTVSQLYWLVKVWESSGFDWRILHGGARARRRRKAMRS